MASAWVGSFASSARIDITAALAESLLTSDDSEDSALSGVVAEINGQLFRESGVALLSGLPVREWSLETSMRALQKIGARLGTLRPQDSSGKLLHLVTDKTVLGVSAKAAGGSNSRKEITLHTENARPPAPPDILALLCFRAAGQGGCSVLLDGYHVHNTLLTSHPSAYRRAWQPIAFGRHEEDQAPGSMIDFSPIFRMVGDSMRFRYSRYWLDIAAETLGEPMTPKAAAMADAIDRIIAQPDAACRLRLEEGEALFLNNARVMHGREAFEDYADNAQRRCLVRMWIDT